MNAKRLGMLCMWPCFVADVGRADIPVPDAMVWGGISIGDLTAVATDDVTLIARVERLEVPIATYRMGGIPTAGDRYVLRFPHAVQDDGHTPSMKMGLPGEVAKIHVQVGSGPEQYVTDVVIPPSGDVVKLDLSAIGDSLLANRGLPGGALCGAGAAECGAVGMISMCLMIGGLPYMRRRRNRQRRS